uniref:Methyltransferase domain-containing protein n=1 Tax=Pinguiococcus pyrenoidosus TaxID=172671 RepID=A0A7R9Y7Y9_9STRA|mmetsp:Transcript_10183/g.38599  ORF Transcript_10183/g.38599 Transcript_10183/m.38599 type:complete len:232 (+) Transcript_10183:41-736(+)
MSQKLDDADAGLVAAADTAEVWEDDGEDDWMPFPPGDGDERSLGPVVLTPPHIVDKLIGKLDLDGTFRVYDLGSGDGELLLKVAEQTGARCVGFEIKEDLVQAANRMAVERKVSDKVVFRAEDLLDAELVLGAKTVLIIFLTPWAMNLLEDKLAEALQAGCRVISCWWPVDGLIKRVGCDREELWGNTYLYSMPKMEDRDQDQDQDGDAGVDEDGDRDKAGEKTGAKDAIG